MQNESTNVSTIGPASPTNNELCLQYTNAVFYGFGMPIYALVAILIISLFERRRYRSDVCHGRPGLPLPINFLDGTSNSVANAAAFGCTLEHILMYLFVEISVNRWLIAIVLFLLTFLAALVFYPIFACLNSPSRVFGSLVGFLYTVLLTVVLFTRSYLCDVSRWYWALHAVTLISEIYIMILFAYRFLTAILKKSKFHKEILVKIDQVLHVKKLLVAPKSEMEGQDIRQRIVTFSETVLAEAKLCCLHKSMYRCTTRTLVINTIVLLVFYSNFLLTIYAGEIIESRLNRLLAVISDTIIQDLQEQINIFSNVLSVSFITSNIISAVYLIANMVLIYRSQKQHLERRWKGDKSFIPTQCKLSPSEMLVKNLMYAGHQVSYLCAGYIISQLVVFVFCLLLSYFFILPIMKKVPELFLIPLETLLPGVIFLFVLRFILRFISGRAFLQDHYIRSDNGGRCEKALSLDNRRVYQNLSFFLFFYYILTGLYRCTFRVITSVCINAFYIPRMDKPLLIPGFERFDIGYMTYLGFLEVELHQCHPVVVVCCDLLLKSVNHLPSNQDISLESPMEAYKRNKMCKMYTRRVRNKWQKLKTLMLNQNLCKESKSNVSFQQPRPTKLNLLQ